MSEDEPTQVAAPEPAEKKPAAPTKKGAAKPKAKGKGADKKKQSGNEASVAAHPRATRNVRRAKGWSGLAGFCIAAYLSYRAGAPFVVVGGRALLAGIGCYLVAWAVAITVWRHLVIAEIYEAVERVRRERAANEQPPIPGTG